MKRQKAFLITVVISTIFFSFGVWHKNDLKYSFLADYRFASTQYSKEDVKRQNSFYFCSYQSRKAESMRQSDKVRHFLCLLILLP